MGVWVEESGSEDADVFGVKDRLREVREELARILWEEGEGERVRGRRGRRGPYIDFADAVHFDDCESYGLYKQGMRLRVYRDVVM